MNGTRRLLLPCFDMATPQGQPLRSLVVGVDGPLTTLTVLLGLLTNVFSIRMMRRLVTPIFKRGDRSAPANYRPISLTSSICKVMERMVARTLLLHMRRNNIISDKQHGFLAGRSTVTQLLACVNDWTRELDAGRSVDVVYMDIAKAFDSVPHAKLLEKAEAAGVTGDLLNWLAAYLRGRWQRVGVDGALSDETLVESGVPQGTVLGPILFLLYINDLPQVVRSCSVQIYADDTKLYFRADATADHEALGRDLAAVCEWAARAQLSVAIQKCAVLHLGGANPRRPLSIDGASLPSVDTCKDLGVLVAADLKFGAHIDRLISDARRLSAVLFKAFTALLNYLVFLALWDIALLIVSFFFYSLRRNLRLIDWSTWFLAYASPVVNGLAMTTMTGSIWIAMTIAVARYVAVCHPLARWADASKSNATAVCRVVSVAALLFSLPTYFELTVRECRLLDGSGRLSLQPWPTSIWRSAAYRFGYHVALNFLFLTGAPFVVMLALTVGMIRAIRQSDRNRPDAVASPATGLVPRSTVRARNATLMLVVLLSKFLVCHSPPIALNVWESIGEHSKAGAERFLLFASLSNYLVVLNSATNFFVYFWWRRAFNWRRSSKRSANAATSSLLLNEMRSVSSGGSSPAQRLLARWLDAERRNAGQTGTLILLAILRRQPSLGVHLGMRVGRRRSSMAVNAQASRAGDQLGVFIERLFLMARAGRSEVAVVAAVRRVGRAHAERGVELTDGVWLEFRRALVQQMFGISLGEFFERVTAEQAEASALSQLITLVITEMKMTHGCTRELTDD